MSMFENNYIIYLVIKKIENLFLVIYKFNRRHPIRAAMAMTFDQIFIFFYFITNISKA